MTTAAPSPPWTPVPCVHGRIPPGQPYCVLPPGRGAPSLVHFAHVFTIATLLVMGIAVLVFVLYASWQGYLLGGGAPSDPVASPDPVDAPDGRSVP